MPATAGITGKGTKLSNSSTQAGTYTFIAEVRNVAMPELSVPSVDATNYESPSSFSEKKPTGWQDVADVAFEMTYTKTQTTAIYALSGVAQWWKITLSDASVFAFPGFLSKLGGSIPNKDMITQSGSITVTGPVTFTAGA